MQGRRIWLAGGMGLALGLVTLWGWHRGGTAAELLPEPERTASAAARPAPAAVNTPVSSAAPGQIVMKYDANTYVRTRPLRDPFQLPGEGAAGHTQAAGVALDRPVLQGILILGGDRRAMVETGGRTATLKVGEQTGLWTVMEIAEKQVVLSGPTGQTVLSL